MSKLRRECDIHRTLGVVVCLLYLAVAFGVNFLHNDDCCVAYGEADPPNDSCPACKFLANSYSAEILTDSLPAIVEQQFDVLPIVTSPSVATPCLVSSIVLRGPPSGSQI